MGRDVGILFGLFVMYVRENHLGGKNAKQQKKRLHIYLHFREAAELGQIFVCLGILNVGRS